MLDFLSLPVVALIALGIACLADIITTERALRRGGREANPVVAWFMRKLGGRGWIIAKALLTAAAGYLLFTAGLVLWIWALAALTLAVAYWNTTVQR